MKKIMIAIVFVLAGGIALAQGTDEVVTEATVAAAQDGFAEIAVTTLPEAITEAVVKNYPTATINKAYVNEANQFRLEVSLEDGTSGTLYADENGNWLEME